MTEDDAPKDTIGQDLVAALRSVTLPLPAAHDAAAQLDGVFVDRAAGTLRLFFNVGGVVSSVGLTFETAKQVDAAIRNFLDLNPDGGAA